MKQNVLQTIMLRNEFYRDNFRRVVVILMLSVLMNIVLLMSLFFIGTKQQTVVYFATTPDGKLIKMEALSKPLMNDSAILSWVNENLPEIYNLDFMNYRRQLEKLKMIFTPYGWGQFERAFGPTIEKIKTQKLVAHAAPYDVPYITAKGKISGIYSWRVQVPLLVTYQAGENEQVEKVIWTVVLQRVNNAASNQLVGISQIIQQIQDN